MMSKWAICSEKTRDWLICSFLVSDLSHLLIVSLLSWVTWAIHSHHSLIKREWANCSCFFELTKNMILFKIIFSKLLVFVNKRAIEQFAKKMSDLLICSLTMSNLSSHSLVMSNLSDLLTIAHLSWATWAISSQFLIFPEQSEQIAQSCSLQWAILFLANERWANELMSKFQPWNPLRTPQKISQLWEPT